MLYNFMDLDIKLGIVVSTWCNVALLDQVRRVFRHHMERKYFWAHPEKRFSW